MIFEKQNILLNYSKSNSWNQNLISTTKVVNGKKYRIRRNQNGIMIERKFNDIFDTMGFVPLKMLAIAKGKINDERNQTKVNLIVELKPIYEVLFIASGILFGLIAIFICFIDLKIGLLFSLILMIIIVVQYLMFKHGLSAFRLDLEGDIHHFDK